MSDRHLIRMPFEGPPVQAYYKPGCGFRFPKNCIRIGQTFVQVLAVDDSDPDILWINVDADGQGCGRIALNRKATSGTYFAQSEATGLVKAGTSEHIQIRLASLCGGSSEPIRMFAWAPLGLEKVFHDLAAPWKKHGEWFKYDEYWCDPKLWDTGTPNWTVQIGGSYWIVDDWDETVEQLHRSALTDPKQVPILEAPPLAPKNTERDGDLLGPPLREWIPTPCIMESLEQARGEQNPIHWLGEPQAVQAARMEHLLAAKEGRMPEFYGKPLPREHDPDQQDEILRLLGQRLVRRLRHQRGCDG